MSFDGGRKRQQRLDGSEGMRSPVGSRLHNAVAVEN
jgi:hypothetical protein